MDPITATAAINAGAQVASGAMSLFNKPNSYKNMAKQRYQQNELNEQAAKTNFNWGEKAADSAFARQMQAYERTLIEESPEAMVKRYKAAGLNPALMYEGGGGQIGSMSAAPQAETGGAQAGQADSPAQMQMASANKLRIGLEAAQLQSQIALTQAQTENIRTQTDKTKGVDTEEAASRIDLNNANLQSENARRIATEIDTEIKRAKAPQELQILGEELNAIRRSNRIGNATERDEIYQKGILQTIMKGIEIHNARETGELIDAQTKEAIAKAAEHWINVNHWREKLPPMNQIFGGVTGENPGIIEKAKAYWKWLMDNTNALGTGIGQ